MSVPVELKPGDVALRYAGESMRTLLGSCVTVILTDPRRTVGTMCHIVHVGQPDAANLHNTAFGSVAMSDMCTRLLAVGAVPHLCQAYVLGGGHMFSQWSDGAHVGANNADWVLVYLQAHGIPVLQKWLGGTGYRKVSWTVGPDEPVVETVFPQQGRHQGR